MPARPPALRRSDPLISQQNRRAIEGAVLGEHAFVLRWSGGEHGDRLLVVNLASELELKPAPEPLLAPACGADWQLIWSSDETRYGGPGALNPSQDGRWRLPAESASLLIPTTAPRSDLRPRAG